MLGFLNVEGNIGKNRTGDDHNFTQYFKGTRWYAIWNRPSLLLFDALT